MSSWLAKMWIIQESPSPVMVMVFITLGLLAGASLIIESWARLRPNRATNELRKRTRSWWVMAILFILAVTIDERVTFFFIALLCFMAVKEFFTLVHLRLADREAVLLAYLAIPIQFWWVYIGWYGMFVIFIPVYMFIALAITLVFAGDAQRFTTSVGKLHWGLMAFVYGLSHLAYFLSLEIDPIHNFDAGGRALLFYVVFLIECNDVLQFIFGKLFGRRKIAPTISPGKTLGGVIGGLLGTMLLAVALRFLTPFSLEHAIAAGLIIGSLGLLGDLTLSAVKRDVGVKDASKLIPGHGGLLDRVDSMCFAVPVSFHFIRYFYGA